MWQDFLITSGGFVLALALLPAIFGKHKPPISTSLLTGAILASFGVAFATLDLWLSATAMVVETVAWGTLAVQVLWQTRVAHTRDGVS